MFILLIVLVFIFLSPISNSEAAVDLGVSIGEEGVRGFYLAVSDYYRVPEREVIVVRERHIPDEELPVVFFIAQRAHVRPATIIDLRMRGRTWMDVTLHFGLGPEIFYVPVKEGFVTGPPYGKAYGYYKKKPRKEWRKIVLDDNDVINLVNLRFISYHYGYEPERVMKMREGGRNFIMINDEVAKERGEREDKRKGRKREGKI